jgi:hypothetical protein
LLASFVDTADEPLMFEILAFEYGLARLHVVGKVGDWDDEDDDDDPAERIMLQISSTLAGFIEMWVGDETKKYARGLGIRGVLYQKAGDLQTMSEELTRKLLACRGAKTPMGICSADAHPDLLEHLALSICVNLHVQHTASATSTGIAKLIETLENA